MQEIDIPEEMYPKNQDERNGMLKILAFYVWYQGEKNVQRMIDKFGYDNLPESFKRDICKK